MLKEKAAGLQKRLYLTRDRQQCRGGYLLYKVDLADYPPNKVPFMKFTMN